MWNYRLVLLCALPIPLSLSLLSASSSRAERCPSQIVARRDLGLSAPQSVAAQMHHQPTVASVAAAEKRAFTSAFGWTPGCMANKNTWKARRRDRKQK
jgi:hypothetical protein